MSSKYIKADSYFAMMVTVGSVDEGKELARVVVTKKLAACVNIIPEITSIYEWDGKIEESSEALLIIKSKKEYLERLSDLILEKHSYDVPEIITFEISGSHSEYIAWIDSVLGKNTHGEDGK